MSTTTVIKARRLLDGTGSPSLQDAMVVVRGKTIVEVGPEQEVEIPRDAHLESLAPEETLLPGLVDAHFHPSLCWYLNNYLLLMEDPPQELFFRALRNLRLCLDSGVTTVRCLAERGFVDLFCRRAIQQGWIVGPRMVTCTRGFRAERGHGFLGLPVLDVDQLMNGFAENVEAGADFLKFFVTGTTLVDGDVPRFLSREEIREAVRAAHRLGKKVTVHAVGGAGLHDCLDAGVDCIEHGYFADDEAIAKMRDRGIPLVITSGVFFDEEALENHHEPQAFREQRYKVYERLAAAFEGGVDIAVGTDGMVGKLANEVRFLSGLGASAEKAVRAATLRGADIAGLGATVGTIEPGKRADVISVSGNPCEDLRSLDYVGLVMMSGKRIDPVLQQMYEREEDEAFGGDEHA